MLAIAEISGADSIAAVLQYAADHPECTEVLPTYVATGTEFGDFGAIEHNVKWLREELLRRNGPTLLDLERSADESLWRAINGRFAAVLTERYGQWLPCVGCHLYLHLMRVPIAERVGSRIVITGEREHHDARTKANQEARVLDAYRQVLAHAGVTLEMSVRQVTTRNALFELLGERWAGGSPQLECVLSGNERGLSGAEVSSAPEALIDDYVVPLGFAVVEMMRAGLSDWEHAAAMVLGRD